MLEQMRACGVPPDVRSYSSAMQACVAKSDMQQAMQLLARVWDEQLTPDAAMLNTLLGGRATLSQSEQALQLVDAFEERGVRPDVLSYSLLIRACVRGRNPEGGERSLRLMQQAGLQPSAR